MYLSSLMFLAARPLRRAVLGHVLELTLTSQLRIRTSTYPRKIKVLK
jgi:hypothetical protein